MKTSSITLAVATAAIIMSGCGESSSSNGTNDINNTLEPVVTLQSGQFIDSAVSGLQYTCNPSNRTGVTNTAGIFTCNEGDTISFYIAENLIGSAILQDIISPLTFFPNNNEAALNLAQLLQTLDEDGNPDNGIVIDNTKAANLLNVNLDFRSASFDDDTEILLSETLVNVAAAGEHLQNSLFALNGDGQSSSEATSSEDAPSSEEASSSSNNTGSSSSHDFGGIGGVDIPDFEVDDGAIGGVEIPDLTSSSSEEASSSSHGFGEIGGVDIPDFEVDDGAIGGVEIPDFTSSSSEEASSSSHGFGGVGSISSIGNIGTIGTPDIGIVEIPDFTSSSSETASSSSAIGSIGTIGVIQTPDLGGGVIIPAFLSVNSFKTTSATFQPNETQATFENACKDEFGSDARVADFEQIEQLEELHTDMETLIVSMGMVNNDTVYINVDEKVATTKTNLFLGTVNASEAMRYTTGYEGELGIDNGITNIQSSNVFGLITPHAVACYNPIN